jgi:hypothetical protein
MITARRSAGEKPRSRPITSKLSASSSTRAPRSVRAPASAREPVAGQRVGPSGLANAVDQAG